MWLIPSRRRIDKLRTFCQSCIDTKTSTPGLIIIDKKDFEENTHAYSEIAENYFPTPEWKIEVTQAEGMGPKVREVWPGLLEKDLKWVGLLNDDHYCVTKEWDRKMIKLLNGTNFATCNDHWNAPARAAGATIWSMELLKVVGWPIFPPQIDHLGIDDVWENIGKMTGCWKIDMSVVVEHHHVYQDMAGRIDDTHRQVYGAGTWAGSPQMIDTQERMQKFVAEDFKPACDKIRAFRYDKRTTVAL